MLVSTGETRMNITPEMLKGLEWRSIGPAHFGGRVTDVAGVPGDPKTLYVAHASAGLFKSTNGGTTFTSIFNDGSTLSVGAIALSPQDPNVIYIGTGEGDPRNSTSFGDGIYKSEDGGKRWAHLGLDESERFSTIVVHPQDPDIVMAGAMGHEWGPNEERGVYRSSDGGKTWTRVLHVNDTTGASDLCLDPGNPDIVYAGMYDYLRQPWHFRSGGSGSGLYRSSDGGRTWTRLTDPVLRNGLPGTGLLGRIGVSVSRSNPNVVYTIIESQEEGELWRSEDRGMTWKMVNADPRINNRPFYYSDIRADPEDENRVYSLAGDLWVSVDGGRTFSRSGSYMSRFGDNHALWIDPADAQRLLLGNDGGFYISNDRGEHWHFLNNMPMAQAYHVGVDMDDPYHVLGGFQDHEIWRGPNEKWNQVGVRGGDWRRLRYMADGMYTVPDPRDSNIVYYNGHFGDITRVDLRTGEERYIQPYPVGPTGTGAHAELYRFNWNSPIHMSPTNPDVIYYGGNVLFKTTDGGDSWEIISPDLTTNDPQKMKLSGGPITLDNTRAEYHCTILAIAESPVDPEVIWVGTDDGNIQITRDGGVTWTNVSDRIQGFPPESWVSAIKASYKEAGTAYVAVDQHRMDDFAPYAFMTTDFGATWIDISGGLRGYVHIALEDPHTPNLLYAGTELGIFASFNHGRTWTDLRLGLPPLSVRDMVVHPRDNDLVIATHARGFYILDDVTPLQNLAGGIPEDMALFPPRRATRYTPASDTSTIGDNVFAARNKPYGAVLSYYLAETLPQEKSIELEILNADGQVIQSLEGPGEKGVNRIVWNLREDTLRDIHRGRETPWYASLRDGPRVMPGEYRVRLSALGKSVEQSLSVRLDPRIRVSPEDLAAYYEAVKNLVRMQFQIGEALHSIQEVSRQLAGLRERLTDSALEERTEKLSAKLSTIRDKLQPPRQSPENINLRGKISWLLRQVRGNTGRPTRAQAEWIGIFDKQLEQVLEELREVYAGRLSELNKSLRSAGLSPIRKDKTLSF